MTRLWCSRTIRRHLKKQGALVASSVPLVNSPSLAIGNSLSVPPANSSPISPPNYDANSSPISAPNYDAQNELPCELDDEPGEAQAGLPSRGRPRRDLDFANQPLGSLLLDMRDKFPNMTEGVIDAQFALHNANKALGVDRDITGSQARRMHARRTKDMVEVFRLCHNQCSIQYGLLQDAISCPKCDAPYDGGCVYIFDMETKIFDLLRSYSWPEICPPPDSNVTRSFIDSPRCREVLSLMPGHPSYRVLVSASFDGGVPWKRATNVDLWPFLLRIWNIPIEYRNKRDNLVLALLVDVYPKNCNVVLEPLMDVFRKWWTQGVWVNALRRRAFIGNTIFHADLKGQASCLRLEGPVAFHGCCRCYASCRGPLPGLFYTGHGHGCRVSDTRTHESARADVEFGTPFRGTKGESVFANIPGVMNAYRVFVFDGMHQVKNLIKRWISLSKGQLVPKKPMWKENSRVPLTRQNTILHDWRAQVEKHRAFTISKAKQREVDRRWRELPCPPALINHGYGIFQHTGSLTCNDWMHFLMFDSYLFKGILLGIQYDLMINVFSLLSRLAAVEHNREELDTDLRHTIHNVLERCEKELPRNMMVCVTHTLVHSPDDILYCGPWRDLWCFPFERFMAYMRTVINSKKSPAMNLAKRYCSSMLNHALAIDERRLIQVFFIFSHSILAY